MLQQEEAQNVSPHTFPPKQVVMESPGGVNPLYVVTCTPQANSQLSTTTISPHIMGNRKCEI
ncbi:hypothetical protein D1BOALGB6SA_5420 [Olavius sp. associated proteobacterium Delta 1]|nr:hypothetical protein D1BOALGB6SA_5420 [Olavius sp. associated proteobacterium Delta 1]